MPLVILCGFPASGKTTRAKELQAYLADNFAQRHIHMVSEHSLNVNKNELYSSSHMEKEIRSSLKSTVQRLLNKDDVVILDSLNYIKGFRYELYCVSKGCHTTQCVVHCDANKEVVTDRNKTKAAEAGEGPETYQPEVLDGLIMRFEPPNPNNRWDSPLFVVHPDDSLPGGDICAALFERKAPPPNQSTQSQPLSSTNFLYELDRVTQDIVSRILDAQKNNWVPGEVIMIPTSDVPVTSTRVLPLAELQRHKRQFINYTKLHPVTDTTKLAHLFVLYLTDYIK
ncbi:protein KTI12 homolog [Littorina saxatilis]|uniref:Protein KTI12 homolog n=1 Tax=Littorina saxatilis TaxID=31220 RepID=A0AAN9BWY3_9CAEN